MKIFYNHKSYTIDEFLTAQLNEDDAFGKKSQELIKRWKNGDQTFTFFSSGSTGTPKPITFSREQIKTSISMTQQVLGLSKGMTGLVCLPVEFIAGAMMVLRSLEIGLNLELVTPSSNPLENVAGSDINFAAFTPLQVLEMVSNPNSESIFNDIKIILVGGAPFTNVPEKIKAHPGDIYETYGMAETLTHIALRKINHPTEEFFKALDSVGLSTDSRGCLVINTPVSDGEIITNDLVELSNSSTFFKVLGRFDNVINTGGIKVSPEALELAIQNLGLIKNNFFITAISDKKLGKKIVLVIESDPFIVDDLLVTIKKALPKYQSPKQILFNPTFVRTPTGKLNRAKTLVQVI